MSTYTIHPHERHHHGATTWTLQHPAFSTIAALAAAVVAGVLIGILFSLLFSGTEAAVLHRAGGHALAAVTQAQHAATAAVATVTATEPAVVRHIASTRSPARGGFAVGRSEGAGTGVIVVHVGTRAPARGGFPARSFGAGRAPAAGVMRAPATGG
jgi:hypothetical protein